MLYKKVHRQHVREFRQGRKYKIYDSNIVFVITKKPRIDSFGAIYVQGWCLITITGPHLGKMWHYEITWLD